ncbi:hypothetical protein [Persicobacter diffluens]|uniref:Uncharacterized protein n=1 Tax=Persicobacter diffluens TaxID=981 RepID=A0AAN4W0F7_9BACT|nr:hypothetical protein PEDI_31660 [Persicobacter diffluens]
MKYNPIIFLLLLLGACAEKKGGEEISKGKEKVNFPVYADYETNHSDQEVLLQSVFSTPFNGQKGTFVGLKKGLPLSEEEVATQLKDTLLLEKDNAQYWSLKQEQVLDFLTVEWVDSLFVFGENGKLGEDQRPEKFIYFEDLLESGFIALFPDLPLMDSALYVMKFKGQYFPENQRHIPLDKEVKREWKLLQLEQAKMGIGSLQFGLLPDSTCLSFYAYSDSSGQDHSQLYYWKLGMPDKAHVQALDWVISDVVVTPLIVRGKPVLLGSGCISESDVCSDFPLVFDGEKYQMASSSIFVPADFQASSAMVFSEQDTIFALINRRLLREDSLSTEALSAFMNAFFHLRNMEEVRLVGNELMLDLLYQQTEEFLLVFGSQEDSVKAFILKELAHPVIENYDPAAVMDKVEFSKADKAVKVQVLTTLENYQATYIQ